MAARTSQFYLSVSWRNLLRHRRRTLITAVAMGLGIAMCMATIALQDGLYSRMFDLMVTQSIGHVQVHHPDYPAKKRAHDTLPAALAEPIRALPEVVSVAPRMYSFALAGGADTSSGAQIVGVSPREEASITGLDRTVHDGVRTPEHSLVAAVRCLFPFFLAEERQTEGSASSFSGSSCPLLCSPVLLPSPALLPSFAIPSAL